MLRNVVRLDVPGHLALLEGLLVDRVEAARSELPSLVAKLASRALYFGRKAPQTRVQPVDATALAVAKELAGCKNNAAAADGLRQRRGRLE